MVIRFITQRLEGLDVIRPEGNVPSFKRAD